MLNERNLKGKYKTSKIKSVLIEVPLHKIFIFGLTKFI